MDAKHKPDSSCPYCRQEIVERSREHIFPEFLGGTRCIPACKPCNDTFGNGFEARAASIFHPFYIFLNSWGLPVTVQGPRWRNAYAVDGQSMDLRIGSDQPIMTASSPIVLKEQKGQLRAEFRSEQEVRRFLKKHPDAKDVEINRIEQQSKVRLSVAFSIGPDVRKLAAKMCIALSRLVPTLDLEEVVHARDALHSDAICASRVATAFNDYSLDEHRPGLAHTVYIERGEKITYGVVQFFGTFQLFCRLGKPGKGQPRVAFLATLDPLTGSETFTEINPLKLQEPPAFYAAGAVPDLIQRWKQKFRDAAVARGAPERTKINLSNVNFNPKPVSWQSGTVDLLLRKNPWDRD